MLKGIIVDDEPKAIELLESYCSRIETIVCLKSFRNPIEALQYLETNCPDIIFLDINMPNLSGMQLAKLISPECHIIFTTAYSEHAVDSYNLNATDYLLKPITFQRFKTSIEKVLVNASKNINHKEETHTTISIKSGYQKHLLTINAILFLEKHGNYMKYHTKEKTILTRQTISEALTELPSNFLQIHKSFIVATEKIELITSKYIEIASNRLPIGSKYKSQLKKFISYDGKPSISPIPTVNNQQP